LVQKRASAVLTTYASATNATAAAAAAWQATYGVTGMLLEVLLYLLCYCRSRPLIAHAILQNMQQHNHRFRRSAAVA
jgi:hypothetical protein